MPPQDRMVVLKLWITVTFVPYAIYMWYDETDYKKREAREIAKEKKRKQKEELLDEKIAEARRIRKEQMKNFKVESADETK
jgi:predicted membrane protein